MNEKKAIEKATAEGFLYVYNFEYGCNYKVQKLQENPDVRCVDAKGNVLNLEITMTEDREGDIKEALGRSQHRTISCLENKNVVLPPASCLTSNVTDNIIKIIKNKSVKNYGSNVALVIRDTSGCDWNWECALEEIRKKVNFKEVPFDKGVWILNLDKTKLYRVDTPSL